MSEETLDQVMAEKAPEVKPVEPTPEVKEEVVAEVKAQPEPQSESSSDDIVKGIMKELARTRELNRELKAKAEPKQEPTNIFEDPEKRLTELSDSFDAKLQNVKITMSESYARKVYPDFDQKLDTFLTMIDSNPLLAQQMNSAPDPATFAYETAKQKLTLDQVGDISEFEKTIQQKAEAAAEEKFKKLYAEKFGKELPTSLADTRAAADNTSFVDSTLDEVIGVDATHR